jgi:hypothetical protein
MQWLRFAAYWFILLPILLGGCASVVPKFDIPTDPDSGTPTVRSIVDRITCEFNEMLEEPTFREFLLMGDIDVALQLTLTVNDTGALTPSFTYTNGVFGFNAGATLSQSREQNFTETLYYSMRQLDRDNQLAKAAGRVPLCNGRVDTNLAGNLGLRNTVAIAIQSPNLNFSKKLVGMDGEFGGYVNFVVTKNLNAVGPTWTLAHFKGPGSFGAVSEVNTDKLVFAFAQGADVGKPYSVFRTIGFARAKAHLESININQLTTQLGVVGTGLR